jgi:dGTPase
MAAPGVALDSTMDAGLQRRVADYVAGMTDRFALREHERLTGRRILV